MLPITRRNFVAVGTTALALPKGFGSTLLASATASVNTPLPPLTVEITFPGGNPIRSTCIFDIAQSIDMGNYVAPSGSFVQRCIRARNPSLPHFFVDFRPDNGSSRIEVVLWNGECFGSVPDGFTRDLPAYNAVIKNAGQVIHTEAIRQHVWGCRWRYQSAIRPEIRTAAQVYSDGFLPHMSRQAARIQGYAGIIVPPTPPAVGTYKTFMPVDNVGANTKLGLVCDVDRGGERPEIGLVTEWQADYLLNGTPSSRSAMYQQAEMCGGDWHWYLTDQGTGTFVNYKQDAAHYRSYTYYNHYGNPGQYYQIGNGCRWNGWDCHEADSHVPSIFYVPYALTEDPYYIEGQQAVVQWGAGWDIYDRETVYGFGKIGGPTTCSSYIGETRTMGWGIRNLAMAYKMSPQYPPHWLLPQWYYGSLSIDYSIVIHKLWTTNPAPLYSVFNLLSNDNYFQTFEQAYAIMGMALADMVRLPASPNWSSALSFYFGMLNGTLSGTTGWNHQVPCPHDIFSAQVGSYSNWAQAYAALGPVFTSTATFPNAPSPFNRQGGSMGNTSQVYAACALAKRQGVTQAPGCFNWLNTFIDVNYPDNRDASGGIPFYMKCGFDGT